MSETVAKRTISVRVPDGEMKALVRSLPGDDRPLAVLFHDGPGVRPAVEEVAERTAHLGFLTVVPDLYHRLGEFPRFGGPPGSVGHAEMITAIRSVAEGPTAADTLALLKTLRSGPWSGERAACLGFCVGASAALRVMELVDGPFTAAALFHPSWCVTDAPDSPHREADSLTGRIYVAIGAADKVSPPEANQPLIEKFDALGSRASVAIHAGAEHGFMMSDSHYDADAARRSWADAKPVLLSAASLPHD